ncbi:hypothetical protein ACQJBY_054495 [Aegilops geniculata]
MEGLELVMEGPSSLFPSLHFVGWLDGRPPLVRLCFFHRCSPPTIVPETLCQARKGHQGIKLHLSALLWVAARLLANKHLAGCQEEGIEHLAVRQALPESPPPHLAGQSSSPQRGSGAT